MLKSCSICSCLLEVPFCMPGHGSILLAMSSERVNPYVTAQRQPDTMTYWCQDAVDLCVGVAVDTAVPVMGLSELDKFGSHLGVNFHIIDILDGNGKATKR